MIVYTLSLVNVLRESDTVPELSVSFDASIESTTINSRLGCVYLWVRVSRFSEKWGEERDSWLTSEFQYLRRNW